ncbi:MAG: sugar phosphate isomerase/epimerase [Acidobacteriia bacterium]|nr:sugar phosphate isomerase/epimerase [Terriglobia bacterium]
MNTGFNRREFLLKSSSIAIGGVLLGSAAMERPAAAASGIKKGACIGVLPEEMTVLEKFEVAKRAGFDGVEPNTLNSADEVKQYKEAAEKTGVKITSIMNSDHWKYPLSDNDPEVVKKCIEGLKTSMHNAHDLDAGAVLLVPGVVTADVRYAEVYRRSQDQIRKLLPLAKKLKVIIAIENVGNRFLLSPLEMARYVDEFKSPWIRSYFDIGNVVSMGYPQDWIRTLGKRVCRVHIKRFEPGTDHPKFDPKDRRTQGIDWPDVRKALSQVGYSGWVTAEVKSGDENYVKEVSARMDRIFSGQNPV